MISSEKVFKYRIICAYMPFLAAVIFFYAINWCYFTSIVAYPVAVLAMIGSGIWLSKRERARLREESESQ